MEKKKSTSWQPVGKWYGDAVGTEGLYYHRQIIIPSVLRLARLGKQSSILDLACGQGILGRAIPKGIRYVGADLSHTLIDQAKSYKVPPEHEYLIADVTKPLPLADEIFSHAFMILALQNVDNPLGVFKSVSARLQPGGKFIAVLNHPCFRIPRHSSWHVDTVQKKQSRCIDTYMSTLKIPIQAHPSRGKQSAETYSFHYPLSQLCQWLAEAGMRIETIEEWCSDKVSEGGAAKMENRARNEIPLFLCWVAVKND